MRSQRHDESVARLEDLRHVGHGDRGTQFQPFAETASLTLLLDVAAQRPIANDADPDGLIPQQVRGVQKDVEPLSDSEVADIARHEAVVPRYRGLWKGNQ